tara:strand:+ start:84 stop:887 length:804 start_codon:yes stop_codon:yes gene_type:complete
METVEKSKGNSFLNHVFYLDDENKNELFNLLQYSIISIIPIIILNKGISKYIPPADEEKESLEITIEILIQVFIMFFGIYFIHRMITFIPTYSGDKYKDINLLNIVLGFLVIILSLQTKLGEKVNIIFDRIFEFVTGESNNKESYQSKNNNIIVTQPISGNLENINNNQTPQVANHHSNHNTNNQNVNNQNVNNQNTNNQNANNQNANNQNVNNNQYQPNFDNMYQGPSNNLVNADRPNINDLDMNSSDNFLMPANEALGNGFGSLF